MGEGECKQAKQAGRQADRQASKKVKPPDTPVVSSGRTRVDYSRRREERLLARNKVGSHEVGKRGREGEGDGGGVGAGFFLKAGAAVALAAARCGLWTGKRKNSD